MSRRFFTSRSIKWIAGAMALSLLLLLLLFVLVASQLEYLVKRLANPYLADAGISIESLRLSSSDLMALKLPMALLKVDSNLARLDDLELTLAEDWLSAPMGLSQIDSLSVRRAEVSLSQDYFDNLGREQESGASSALNLGALPQIALGEVSFNLLGTQASSSKAQPLGLKLDYLNLDNQGQLTGALSFYQAPLLSLAATLEKTRWRLDSRLEFEPFGRLIGELSALTSAGQSEPKPDTSPAQQASNVSEASGVSEAPGISEMPSLSKAPALVTALHDVNQRLTEMFTLSGSLSSRGELDLIKGVLHSSHEFDGLKIQLKRLGGQTLSPELSITVTGQAQAKQESAYLTQSSHAQSSYSKSIQAQSSQSMILGLNGPLNDLHLTLSPTLVTSSTSLEQLGELAGESEAITALLTALKAQSHDKKSHDKQAHDKQAPDIRAPNQRSADEHTTKLSLELGQEMNGEDALDFSLQDVDVQLGALIAKVETQGLVLAAKLEKARLEKARLEETKLENGPEPKPTSAWQLTGNWQLDAALKQPLCLTLPPYPETSNGCQDRAKNETDIDNSLTLAKANLKLEGELDARQADATDDSTNDSQKNSTLNLTLAGELNLAQPEFNHRDLKVGARSITTEIPAPLNLSINTRPELKLNLDWQRLKVAIDGHHLSWPAMQEMANKEPKAQLTSEQTRTTFGAGHFTFSPGKPLLAELVSFRSVTHSPHLTLPEASILEVSLANTSMTGASMAEASKTEKAAKPLERELTASEFVLEAAQPLRLNAQALVIPPVGLKVIALAASEQKAVQGKGQEQTQTQVKTTQVKTTQVKTTRVNLDELSLATQTIALTPKATKAGIDAQNKAATLSQSTLSLSPDALLAFPWQTEVNYQLINLKVSEESVRLNKLRRKTLLKLPSTSLSQSLQWQGALQTSGSSGTKSYSKPVSEASKILIQLASDLNGHYGLTTKEKWNLDGLPFYSEHHLALTHSLKPRLLTGELTLTSDANELMKRLMRMQGASLENPLIGDINLTSQHNLKWHGDKMDFAFALTPEVKLSEGSYNALPFEQAEFTGQCQLDGVKAPHSQTAKLACEPLSLKVAAFNPGVLITDIIAHAKLELDLTQGETEAALGAQTGAALALSGADVKLDARANTLGGEILLPIFNLNLGAPSSAYLVLQGLDLEQLLAAQPQTGIYADGIFDGVLPVQLEHGQVSITNGQLAARAPGGLIKVDDNPAVLQMRLSQPYLDFAFSALEELHYTQLSSSFDMAPNGDALLKVQVKGRAKDIERPIHLNYAQEENMLQLLKSLQIGDRLQSEIERAMAN
ncbi:YdbH domain-containing protein [Shewanella rhizosphaerae]|uniref:YdbH domain-containing protein n=1 Tax=Shewanella rhizosphaerae TaxID=2864207 RepID=UPI001C65B804|nr:YdbH domain-containing protein [Shewanella rhizosphaerae]QYK11370.1 YdbH domain-containing protein [Shewanella rhizosphaerae]